MTEFSGGRPLDSGGMVEMLLAMLVADKANGKMTIEATRKAEDER